MNDLSLTLIDLDDVTRDCGIEFAITRYIPGNKIDDLDILVKQRDFKKLIDALTEIGYVMSSHDHALGGREKGAQVNLIKESRIKIDLHKDFTWRCSYYLDLDIIWDNLEIVVFEGRKFSVQKNAQNAFLIFINVLFEKSYLNEKDFKYLKSNLESIMSRREFYEQAKKYGWLYSYKQFGNWLKNTKGKQGVLFLPTYLVALSYIEKMIKEQRTHFTSLAYFVFFRLRYIANGKLPYE